MKKRYIIPAIEVININYEASLLAGSVTELLDNTDVAGVDDFNQLSPELTFDDLEY